MRSVGVVEMWKPYKVEGGRGYEYAVSSYGRLFSIRSGKYLSHSNTGGYVNYGNMGSAHRLVAEVFIGQIPEKYQVNHIDGVKTNNHFTNLEIVTASENVQHAHRNNLCNVMSGEDHVFSKLTKENVLSIYNLFLLGYSNKEISERYGIHDRYVSLVRHGKRWKKEYEEFGQVFPKSYTIIGGKLTIIAASNMINEGLTNIEISRSTGLDPSTVSRIRSGNSHKSFIESYNRILKRGGELWQ